MNRIQATLTGILDFFYPLFRRMMPRQVYHYLACGTINTLSDWIFYFLIYNYVIQQRIIQITDTVAISPHIASLILVTPITFTVGFLLSKYITFSESDVHTHHQLWRYASILMLNFGISYICMKVLCETLCIWATPSKMITTVITTVISFFLQKYFSFRKSENEQNNLADNN